jgi:hypothetical protein
MNGNQEKKRFLVLLFRKAKLHRRNGGQMRPTKNNIIAGKVII